MQCVDMFICLFGMCQFAEHEMDWVSGLTGVLVYVSVGVTSVYWSMCL